MAAPLVTLAELKTHLGLTGTGDDTLLASCASNASVMAEQDTGRVFAVSSNVTRYYSTDGQASLTIHDVPFSDSSRVVTWNGAALTENTSYWVLQDRRNPDVATTIQIAPYDTSRAGWYKADPQWWDKNLDTLARRGSIPNDLKVTGVFGHPSLPLDVAQAVTELAAWLYYRAKAGASGTITTPTGETIELSEYPPTYQRFVATWTIRTQVTSI